MDKNVDREGKGPGTDLLSHRVPPAVSSALVGLASVFGMGTGVSPPLWAPDPKFYDNREERSVHSPANALRVEAKSLGRLVPVRFTPYGASTPGLSTRSSSGGLSRWKTIGGRPHLGARFALRCFQRLSLTSIATRLCRWRDNRVTRGWPTPVLSY